MGGGGIGEGGEKVALFAGPGVVPREAPGARRPFHVAGCLAVNLREGDHHLVDRPGQGPGNLGEIAPVPLRRRQRRGDHRIVTPHRHPRPEGATDTVQLADGVSGFDRRRIEGARISGDRLLDDEGIPAVPNFGKVAQKGLQVSSPEDETVDGADTQRHPVDLPAVGVDHAAIPGLEARHEPFTVEGRNVRLVARRDDHSFSPRPLSARRRQRPAILAGWLRPPERRPIYPPLALTIGGPWIFSMCPVSTKGPK